jgi:hypothetical protein
MPRFTKSAAGGFGRAPQARTVNRVLGDVRAYEKPNLAKNEEIYSSSPNFSFTESIRAA